MRKEFEARLGVGDVTVSERDVAALRAIDRHGSMHRAAEELGRSYPHLQRRVDELEAAAGDLTERERGGAGGGGTTLTATAESLLREFSRLRVELAGVASVTESVLVGEVVDRDGELATVATGAGEVAALVPPGVTEVEIAVRSDTVVIRDPGDVAETSLRNELRGAVADIETGEAVAEVTVALDGGPELVALVTARSRVSLSLDPGVEVIAAFKATAARGVDRS